MNNKEKILVIFGADDHESALAREIAKHCSNVIVATATNVDGPVKSHSAYRATGFHVDSEEKLVIESLKEIIYFECNRLIELERIAVRANIHICDHHNFGDPGFNKPAKDFLYASSIGQMCDLLHVIIDDEIKYTAAADHCPAAAYAGQCPGIDRYEFLNFRVKQKSNFENKSEEDIIEEIDNAKEILLKSKSKEKLVDLIGHGFVPQLPESAMMLGLAYVTDIAPPEGYDQKIVIGGHTTQEIITKFMESYREKGYEVYGDEVRGFAGALLKK